MAQRPGRRPPTRLWLLLLSFVGQAAIAQVDPIARDQARRAAEAAAAERQAREDAPQSRLSAGRATAPEAFPVESPCHRIDRVVIDNELPRALAWVRGQVARFAGRCIGQQGLNIVLRDLQAAFLDRGLATTRAGLPEQDLTQGTLHLVVVPGRMAGLRGASLKARRAWRVASPLRDGDLINLYAIEQGLDQMRRLPNREVKVDLAPGAAPGDTIIELDAKPVRPISASLSVNNLAGRTVGRWQATGQVATLDLLGLNEIVSGYYNARVRNPSVPAESTGTGGSIDVPWGWWTFGLAASSNRYRQHIIGQVQDFDSSGTLRSIAATATRVVHRDRVSRTSFQLQLQRRWGRSYIDDIEIGLQHQDLADVQIAAIDRRRFGGVQIDSEVAYRHALGLFGAQSDRLGQPASLPTARYRIFTADIGVNAQLGERLGYRSAFRAQYSHRPLFGPDLFSIGGPFTVRGYEGDRGLIGRAGWYWRQELNLRVVDNLQAYGFGDVGRIRHQRPTPVGLGAGLRAQAFGFTLDSWIAIPVTARAQAGPWLTRFGLTAGWGL